MAPTRWPQYKGPSSIRFCPPKMMAREQSLGEQLGRWSVLLGSPPKRSRASTPATSKPFSGIVARARAGSHEFTGGEGLFYVANVGRGMIVVSAFQLAERDFLDWRGFDGFLNGGLLGRPRRIFSASPFRRRTGGLGRLSAAATRCALHHAAATVCPRRPRCRQHASGQVIRRSINLACRKNRRDLEVDRPGGVASWDDFSPAADVARELLLEAAGVQVPGAGFRYRLFGLLSDCARAFELADLPHDRADRMGMDRRALHCDCVAPGLSSNRRSSISASCVRNPKLRFWN